MVSVPCVLGPDARPYAPLRFAQPHSFVTVSLAMADRGMRVASGGGGVSRAALCIGVSQYASSPLKNAANDASDVADALRDIGFDVTLLLEPSLRQMLDALEAFVAKLYPGGTAVFFFAGARSPGEACNAV